MKKVISKVQSWYNNLEDWHRHLVNLAIAFFALIGFFYAVFG